MTPHHISIADSILTAGPVVKTVMLILITASVLSWTFILKRFFLFRKVTESIKQFEKVFWNGGNLEHIYEQHQKKSEHSALEEIFTAGFSEYKRLENYPNMPPESRIENIERAMRVCANQQLENLQCNLNFLATVGSVSPYIGLFGTVWGIMTSFMSLSGSNQATIAMVAPGISEALIATAFGLFAAIPGVIAFNRFTHKLDLLAGQMENFGDELIKILHREIHI